MTKKVKVKEDKLVEKVISQKNDLDDEPSWYHYVFVLFVLFAFIYGVYFVSSFFIDEQSNQSDLNDSLITYNYPYELNGKRYNIAFQKPLDDVKNYDVVNELIKIDLLNTQDFTFVFDTYNGSDNGQVSKGAIKFRRFLSIVYGFEFDENSFALIDNISCDDSTLLNKVIVFDPYQDEKGIFYDNVTGCINIYSNGDATEIVNLIDKIIYGIVVNE